MQMQTRRILTHAHRNAWRHCIATFALIGFAAGAARAQAAGSTDVAGGSLFVNGSMTNTTVAVSSGGVLGGNGSIGGDVALTSTGVVAPGVRDAAGELDVTSMTWQAGGAIAFQLGASPAGSDRVALSGSLARLGGGSYEFRFTDAATPPTPGTTYTLLTFASQSGFSSGDFSYTYSGSQSALLGTFDLSATALSFTVISTPVELQSFEVD